MLISFRVAPSDIVTVPPFPEPVPPDVTVTPATFRMSTKLVGVALVPTFKPTIVSLNVAALLSARSPAVPRNVNVFPVAGAAPSCSAEAVVPAISYTRPEFAPMAAPRISLPPDASTRLLVLVPPLVMPAETVPKPMRVPASELWPSTIPELSPNVPPDSRILPRATVSAVFIVSRPPAPTSSV